MKEILFFGLVCWMSISIFSCSHTKENKLKGTWFNTDLFEYPSVYIFDEDSFYYPYEHYRSIKIYKTRNDTLLFQGCYEVGKLKYEIKDDTLILKDLQVDSISAKFKKGSSLTEHWNENLQLSIDLPILTSYHPFKWYNEKVILLGANMKDSIYLNGKKLKLDSNLYVNLIPDDPHEILTTKLFIDGEVPMVKLKFLQKELSKASCRGIDYITYDSMANLSQTSLLLPFENFTYPDSIEKKLPPLLKYDIPDFRIDKDLFFVMNQEGIYLNNEKSTFFEFKNRVIKKLDAFQPFTLFIYYDEEVKYKDYISNFFEIRKIYTDKRIAYASEKYGVDNYYGLRHLDGDKSDEIWDLYPMKAYLIDLKEYNKIKKFF